MAEQPNNAMISVIITGASGMVGRGVLLECLDSPHVEKVLVVNREPIGVSHPKLVEVIHDDFFDISAISADLTGYDALFFCAGVSSIGKSEEEYVRLTEEMTLAFAQIAVEINREMTICYVSGAGTDSSEKGRQMWARVKGRTENRLIELASAGATMFRPGIIMPMRGVRTKSKLGRRLYTVLRPLLVLIKFLMPHSMTSTVDVGKAMIAASLYGQGRQHLGNRDINMLAKMYDERSA